MGGRVRVQPLTIVVPVRWFWGPWLRLSWWFSERWPASWWPKRKLLRLRFIHFAHWSLVRRVPRRGGRRLPVAYVVFHTNFNGDLQSYVDAFSIEIPRELRLMLQGAHEFRAPEPLGVFRSYFLERAHPEDHFWCAYPDASVKKIRAGQALQREMAGLRAAAEVGPDAFAARWQAVLRERGSAL